ALPTVPAKAAGCERRVALTELHLAPEPPRPLLTEERLGRRALAAVELVASEPADQIGGEERAAPGGERLHEGQEVRSRAHQPGAEGFMEPLAAGGGAL